MHTRPQPPFINTQLQLGVGQPEETPNRFNGLCVAAASPSAVQRHRVFHIAATRPLAQTVETVCRPLPAPFTQLKLGVNERGRRTGAGISNMTIFTNSGILL